jgi:hypothetical protein
MLSTRILHWLMLICSSPSNGKMVEVSIFKIFSTQSNHSTWPFHSVLSEVDGIEYYVFCNGKDADEGAKKYGMDNTKVELQYFERILEAICTRYKLEHQVRNNNNATLTTHIKHIFTAKLVWVVWTRMRNAPDCYRRTC